LDPDEVSELVARYEDGETVYELATRFGIHRDTVTQFLKDHDVPRRYHERVPVDLAEAAELEAAGLTMTEIAAQLGIGRTTLITARRLARQG
jgi:transposase-like protein